jgi:hypothetical protein
MTPDRTSHVAHRDSTETSEGIGSRSHPQRLCATSATAACVATFVIAAISLAVGCAEEADREPGRIAEPAIEIRTVQQKSPRENPSLDGPEFRLQRKRDWWSHAREVLFSDIALSAEQAHVVDEIIEAQLNTRALLQQLDAEVSAARKVHDSKRIEAARGEFRAVKDQLKKPHEIYEEMRIVVAEEQFPTFDMNRARLVAESQGSGRARPDEPAKHAENE